ncbi:unnamed protein product [Danaus chrysippus]|uniref:(African queen) hypothetical protein n=1 Tax=Danaus chrysippus TaxID=151541 RepID=A0A8J2R7Q2_9NEOP|nr:unnamed protein product [Danaus chrysippus]
MATVILRSIFFAYFLIYAFGGEIEMEVQSGSVLKMLRDMMNQSAAESLNLIANATSIRENITDTFSCENRTYGYYADVENECQLFHVCVPSQSPSGRNTTYRYSFICPAETVFNQEVLVCTRPIDSIPCDESPNFYDLNMEIGKMVDPEINKEAPNKETEMVAVKNKKQTIRKKQNIIMEALMKDGDEQMKELEELFEGEKIIELPEEQEKVEVTYQPIAPETFKTNPMEPQAIINEENEAKPPEMNSETFEYQMPAESGNDRLGSERSIKRTGRKMWRDDDESNEKYIDLLPEEEKEEFLNRIARRILEEVNSRGTPKESHVEINDDQLNAHNAYVNDIIKEESRNLNDERRDNKDDEKKKSDRGDEKADIDPYIDLTLRTKDTVNDSDPDRHLDRQSGFNVIPVKTIYDDDNLGTGDKVVIVPQSLINASSSNDINKPGYITNLENDLIRSDNNKNDSEDLKGNRKSYDTNLLFRTTMPDYDSNSDENNSVTSNDTIYDSTVEPDTKEVLTTTESTDEVTWPSTQKIYDSDNENSDSKSSEGEETTTSTDSTTSNNADSSSTTSNYNSTETETYKQENISSTTPETTLNVSNISDNTTVNGHSVARSGNMDLKQASMNREIDKINGSVLNATEENTNTENKSVKDTTTIATVTELSAGSHVSQKRNIHSDENIEKDVDLNTKETQSLRQSRTSEESIFEDTPPEKNDYKTKMREYEVFEIDPEKPPFVKKSMEEQDKNGVPIYVVPVYNYDPENAYFMPRTRPEPYKEDEYNDDTSYDTFEDSEDDRQAMKSDLPIERSIFSGYKKRSSGHYKRNKENHVLKYQKQNKKPEKKVQYHNIYYSPNDYLDLDYYFGRSNKHQARSGHKKQVKHNKIFPDSNEKDHPYNSLKNDDSIKDHIGAVRKILHLKQIYESIPEIKRQKTLKIGRKKAKYVDSMSDNTKTKSKNHEDSISLDYYFGFNSKPDPVQVGRSERLKIVESSKNNDKNNVHDEIYSILEVLKDSIRFKNEALSKYNWLETTVDILTGIERLFELTNELQFGNDMYPKDLELLKYTLYLYKTSVDIFNKQNNIEEKYSEEGEVKRKRGLLPRNKYKKKITQPIKLWKDVAKFIRNKTSEPLKLLYDFEDFLQKILFYLHDFHDAIKHVAIITKYNKQMWLEDLKDIYLDEANDKQLLKVLLHLSVSRLLSYVDENAVYGVENNYRDYIKKYNSYVKRSKEEFLFVLHILNELKQFK